MIEGTSASEFGRALRVSKTGLCAQAMNAPCFDHLCHCNLVRRSGKHSIRAREWLSTRLQVGNVHGVGHALVADQVLEEQVQIARKVGDRRGSHERVHGSGAVGARVELPRVASNAHRGNGRARAGDGTGTAVGA